MGESYVYITGTSDRQGGRMEDLQAILPDGSEFDFWEQKTQWKREWIVDAKASEDGADGTAAHPFPRIQQAASLAEPGDRVRIHAGVYREWVHPERGGTDPRHMISYEAFGDGKVEIRASEQVKSFRKSTGWRLASNPFASTEPAQMRVYEYDLDPDLFRGYNPFGMVNILHDRLFLEYDKTDMTPFLERRGRIFCDGMPLRQVALYVLGGSERHEGSLPSARGCGSKEPQNRGYGAGTVFCTCGAFSFLYPREGAYSPACGDRSACSSERSAFRLSRTSLDYRGLHGGLARLRRRGCWG